MPYTFTVIDPLPDGLTLSSTGVISGTPTIVVDDDYQIQVSDGTTSAIASIHITAQPYTRPIPIVKEIVATDFGIQFGVELITVNEEPTLLGIDFGAVLLEVSPALSQAIEFSAALGSVSPQSVSSGLDLAAELATLPTFAFDSAIASPIGRSNLTRLDYGPANISSISTRNQSIPFPLYGGIYGALRIRIHTSSYLDFDGPGSTAVVGFSATYPGRTLQIGAANRSWRAVYGGPDEFGSYRIRWEGAPTSDTSGPATDFWEVTLFYDGVIQLVTGNIFTDGSSMLTKGDGIDFTPFTLSANNSWVFFTDGTVQNGSYHS